jgi:putative methionine-R-sulfoxide reductase with GAF domain
LSEVAAGDALAALRSVLAVPRERVARARALAEALREVGGWHWVGLYDVSATHITAIAWSGAAAPAFPSFPRAQGLNGAAVESGRPLVVQDVARDPRWLTTFATSRAEAIFPVRLHGAIVGTIDVESDRVGAFSAADEAFLAQAAQILVPLWDDGAA